MGRGVSKHTTVDEAGACPRAEALRELTTLARGAADGVCAVLTPDGRKEMNQLARALDRRWTKHNATCKTCRGA
jgi:hypothetical protein